MGELYMQSSEYITASSDLYNIDELASETLVGWSSECLDQTISYYLDCNNFNMKAKNEEVE
nr:hypothetical protein Ahn.fas.Kor.pt_241 [Ahnfeltia fastigiata]